ncbi:MAG: glycosyltransferase [Gammaproteobacteria bacterium]|nr:glycosyltransferase [Gammaproteobacteria bacterium]
MKERAENLCLLIPVYDDWESVGRLLDEVDAALAGRERGVRAVLVDDASSTPCPAELVDRPLESIAEISVVELRRNLGHQRALAVGLAYVEDRVPCRAVLIMDGDGEDRPADAAVLVDLLERHGRGKTIFARRARRSEDWWFKALYRIYIAMHRLLTGLWMDIGNFSIVPAAHLSRLVAVAELWNHYAAAVVRARIPFDTVDTERGRRFAGASKMNLPALIIHGLRAFSVYADVVVVRLLIASAVVLVLALLGVLAVLVIRFATDLAVPGWATYATGLLAVLVLQVATISILVTFLLLVAPAASAFLPVRDYAYYVNGVEQIAIPA